jgi:2,4-dienoyl-CoA reductase (NADPH2)
VLAGKVDPRGEIVVVGGGEIGCETTEYLCERGKSVTLVEAIEELAVDMEPLNRHLLLERLRETNIRTLTGMALREVTNEGVVISGAREGRELRAESIVLALGAVPDRLAQELKGRVEQVFVVGDCVKPRRSLEAIHEGSWAGRQI